ncbi:MAG: hypothetical protein WC091_02930 [Sulfuricellaceae bacterium]
MRQPTRLFVTLALLLAGAANAETAMPPMTHQQPMPGMAMSGADNRQLVKASPETIAMLRDDMRQMMAAYAEIFGQLADGNYEGAANTLDAKLGMAAMQTHPGMMQAAQELPVNMRMMGMTMHGNANALANSLRNNNPPPAAVFAGMQRISASCTACHMSFRVR